MSNVLVNDASLTAIANAIRAKNGTQDTYKPGEMAEAITNIHEAVLGTKNITENGTYAASDDDLDGFSSVTVGVSSGSASGTKTVNITENGTVTEDVTAYANAEINVNVPGYPIDQLAMRNGFSGAVVLPTATYIMPYTFANKTGITSFSAPNVTKFTDAENGASASNGSYVFSGCSNLESVDLPSCTNPGSGGYQFKGCIKLPAIHLNCVPGTHMMDGCTGLVTAVFSAQGQWNGNGFTGCTKLEKIDGKPTRIYTSEFNNCAKLDTIVIRSSVIPSLPNVNAFTNTPFASGKAGGTIYIPKTFYDHLGDGTASDYQATTGWSTVHGYGTITWACIEGSQYETKYVDGTDIPSA